MTYNRFIISESEKNRILSLYDRPQPNENIVIIEWLSPDEKYCIFLDDLIDIQNKTKIGNIWENFDYFKFFLKHSFEVASNIPQEIKESVLSNINSFLITESNQNMVGLKPYVKELLKEEGFFNDTVNWAKDTAKSAVQGVKDFTSKSIEGIKKTYGYIKDGDWSKAFDIIKKGTLYVARSIRSALYNPIGILLDAILVASGIGKSLQFVIWSVVVGLDVYELISGNVEDPELSLPWRLLFLGIDILGLVFSGIAAKSARGPIGALITKFGKTSDGFVKAVKSNKFLQGIVQKILNATSSAGGLINKGSSYLQKNSPKIYNFLSGALRGVGGFIKKIIEVFGAIVKGTYKAVSAPGKVVKKVLGGQKVGSAAQSALNVGVPIVAIGGYQKRRERQGYEELSNVLSQTNIEPNYSDIDL